MLRRLSLGLLLLAVAGLVGFVQFRQDHHTQAAPQTGELLVRFKSSAPARAIAALNASMATNQVDQIPALGLRVLRLGPGADRQQVLGAYAHHPLVEFAEENALLPPEATPNDTYYTQQQHLPRIAAPGAWDLSHATGVLIAICDTGVAQVSDLSGSLRGELGYNTADGSGNWSPADSAGHGTLVAGAAAARTDNGVGVAGVAWDATILPVRITNRSDGYAYVSDAAECISYAADHGARAINLSYKMAGSASIDAAAAYAKTRGAVTVVAAGNDGADPGWPNHDGFLAVGATNSLDEVQSWSNHGTFVDLAAPGVNIRTTKSDGTYGTATGTSLSAPIVTGTIGLVFGANPALSPSQAESIVISNADDCGATGYDPYCGYGRVSAGRSVAGAFDIAQAPPTMSPTPMATPTRTPTGTPPPTATPTPSSDVTSPTVTLSRPGDGAMLRRSASIEAQAADNVGVVKVELYVDGQLQKTLLAAPYSTTWNTRRWSNGSHSVMAKAYDAAGNSAVDVRYVTVSN